MNRWLRFIPFAALVMALMASPVSVQAAAPPGPFFQGFEHDTSGWYDSSNGGDGVIMRVPSGYSNGGGYADGVPSAAGHYHARISGDPCDHTPSTNCYSVFTRWGGYSSTFPEGGYKTQADIYLDVAWSASHPDYRFDWDSSINDNTGAFLQDYVFNAGTNPAGAGFFVNASTNATRSGAFPENPCPSPSTPPNACRTPVLITTSGWYTFRHTFTNEAGFLRVDFDIISVATGAPVAHWTIRPGHAMSGVGGNRYGWFVIDEIDQLPIDNTLRTGLCHTGGGDGDVQDNNSGKHGHMHFGGSGCENGQSSGDVEESDQSSGDSFQSGHVDSATFTNDENSQTVTMVGTGVHNGLPVAFTMVAVDNGGLAPPLFSLVLSDGYALTGTVTSGTVTIT